MILAHEHKAQTKEQITCIPFTCIRSIPQNYSVTPLQDLQVLEFDFTIQIYTHSCFKSHTHKNTKENQDDNYTEVYFFNFIHKSKFSYNNFTKTTSTNTTNTTNKTKSNFFFTFPCHVSKTNLTMLLEPIALL